MQARAMALTFAGLPEAWRGADKCDEGTGAAELGQVADPGDKAGSSLRPDAWDRREELADVVGAEQTLGAKAT